MTIRGGGGGPRRPVTGIRALLAAAGVLVLVATLMGCSGTAPRELDGVDGASPSPSESESTSAEPTPTDESEPTDDPTDPTDPATTEPSEEGSTSDAENPPPAESESETLCNLTADYVQVLYDNGSADNWAYMDVAALSLSDSLRIWRGLVADFPDSADDVERAQTIYDLWQAGNTAMTDGDVAEGEQLLTDSLDEIALLPDSSDNEQVGCDQL